MDSGDGDKGRGIDGVHYGVDAFEKSAHARGAISCRNCRSGRVQFAQISPSGENGLLRADKNADRSLRGQRFERSDKLLQFGEHGGANFVGRSMIKGQFDYAFAPFPAQRPAGEISHFHACCLLAASRTAFESYMALISAA